VGHTSSGKTSLAEALLEKAGTVERRGGHLDADPEARGRGASTRLAVAWCAWRGVTIHLIDTPGDRGFAAEAELGAWAADAALVVVSALDGVQIGTERALSMAARHQLPTMVVVTGADVPGIVGSLRAAANLPLALLGSEFEEELVEAVACADDALLERYLDHGGLTPEEVEEGLARGTVSRQLIPVLSASATRAVLDAMVDLLGSRSTCEVEGQRWSAGVLALQETTMGTMALLRVCSGELAGNTAAYCGDSRVRVGRLHRLVGSETEPVSAAVAGDIVGVARLRGVAIGDTLTSEAGGVAHPRPALPEPLVSYVVRPRNPGDADRLSETMARLAARDPGLRVVQADQVLLAGMGQLHIDVTVQRLARLGLEVSLDDPGVPYRETIRARVRGVEGRYKRQTGGPGHFGVCVIDLEPAPRGSDDPLRFESAITGGAIPRQFIPAVEKGIRDRMARGGVAGFPVVDVKVTLRDGKSHDRDSNSGSFEHAGSLAFWAAFTRCGPVLLEPVMALTVTCPLESTGDVIGDLMARRGRVLSTEIDGGRQQIAAAVPMAELARYGLALEALTGGRGAHAATFERYQEAPPEVAERLVGSKPG
jgi:elongation factor G